MRLDAAIERALRRDRLLVLAILATVMVASWAWLLAGAGMEMSPERMSSPGGPFAMTAEALAPQAWSPGQAVITFFMWWIMMVAMMLPGATPAILLFAAVNRRQRERGNPHVPTALFTASYLLAWAGFSLAATALHGLLDFAGLMTPAMAVSSPLLGAVALIAAGIYQLTPLKQACVRHCRAPAQYLAAHWRPGALGAMSMGLRHGTYCLGCCWFLMLLLFVGGVMNLFWIAGLAAYVLLEKSVPAGHALDCALGLILLAAGGALLVLGGVPG